MRKSHGFIAAAFTGIVLAVGSGAAAQAGPWEFAGAFATDAECQTAGLEGTARGEWSEHKCILFEGAHDLYVR